MRRFIERDLVVWKGAPRRKPLVLRGARQVGKTYTVKAFGRGFFEGMVCVDLERNPELHRVFAPDLDVRRICAELEVLTEQAIVPGRTLLFLDEIQACPRALMALRYFFEEMPGLHVIAAGSLLEFYLGEDISFPVGRVQYLQMRPLCFAEYLDALGKDRLRKLVLEEPHALPETIHEKLLREVATFVAVGGMPECVKVYAERGSLRECFAIQADICSSYRDDFGKYHRRTDPLLLNAVLGAVVQGVGEQIKYSRLAEGYSHPTIKKAFDLLRMAGIIQKVPATNPGGLPLAAGARDTIFKALLLDVGLMRHLSNMPRRVVQKEDLLDSYRGALADQFVGQELMHTQNGDLYCWIRSTEARGSRAEVEYLALKDGRLHPVEVKSGATGRLKSIQLFLNSYPHCAEGLVFSLHPYEELPEKRLRRIPIYWTYAATLSERT